MENAIEALEMAFAMFVFVIAISIALILFGQVKKTSDAISVLEDDSRYLEYVKEINTDAEVLTTEGITRVARLVEVKDIIPALYSYSTELKSITFIFNDGAVSQSDLEQKNRSAGIYTFGLGNLGTFDRSLSGNVLTYNVYMWGSQQSGKIKSSIDAFINGGEIHGVEIQTYVETINTATGEIESRVTGSKEPNTTINFRNAPYDYLMNWQDWYFVETYERTHIANNYDGIKDKEQTENDEEYLYVTYKLFKHK